MGAEDVQVTQAVCCERHSSRLITQRRPSRSTLDYLVLAFLLAQRIARVQTSSIPKLEPRVIEEADCA